jgi:ATPase subunit of ABC transporter with duplicated ATPase domains
LSEQAAMAVARGDRGAEQRLEEALEAHAGAVVLASHDRWLRRRWNHNVLDLQPVSS